MTLDELLMNLAKKSPFTIKRIPTVAEITPKIHIYVYAAK